MPTHVMTAELVSTWMRQGLDLEMSIGDWLCRIRAEYREVPGLRLTLPQAQRLWGLDEPMGSALLGALVDVRFLRLTSDGRYVRADIH
ncbi:MAG: hypothetical protein AB7Q29_13720 [Vicinamibacterales bacterium]